jgi:uncharacterized protein (DUF4415 family)
MSISKKRIKQINNISDSQIDYSDIAELDSSFWENTTIVQPKKKVPVSLRLDEDVLKWFKKTGRGYQTKINAVLSSYMQAKSN